MRPDVCQDTFAVFRACLTDQPCAVLPPDRDRFWHNLHRQGLVAPFCLLLKRHGHPDAAFLADSQARLAQAFFQQAPYRALLERLQASLAQAGLEVVLLKGAALWYTAYANPLERHVSDVDLFVLGPTRPRLLQVLTELGFEGNASGSSFMDQSGLLFDIHIDEIGTIERFCGLDGRGLWQRSLTLEANPGFRVLGPADQLAYLSLHALRHSYARLGWLLDLNVLAGATSARPEHPTSRYAFGCCRCLTDHLLGVKSEERIGWLSRCLTQLMTRWDLHPLGKILLGLALPSWTERLRYFRQSLNVNRLADEGALDKLRRLLSRPFQKEPVGWEPPTNSRN